MNTFMNNFNFEQIYIFNFTKRDNVKIISLIILLKILLKITRENIFNYRYLYLMGQIAIFLF